MRMVSRSILAGQKRGAPLPLLRLEEARQGIQNAGRPRWRLPAGPTEEAVTAAALATPLRLEHFRHAGHDHRFSHSFVVAPNYIAKETNRRESALCAAVASLRFHGPRVICAPRTDFVASP
jgi:hypothetical protein